MTTEMNNAVNYIEDAQGDIEGIAAVLRCMSTMNNDELPNATIITDATFFLARELERISESLLGPAWEKALEDEKALKKADDMANDEENS